MKKSSLSDVTSHIRVKQKVSIRLTFSVTYFLQIPLEIFQVHTLYVHTYMTQHTTAHTTKFSPITQAELGGGSLICPGSSV